MSYYDVPHDAAAVFSTDMQRQPKRKLEEPFPSVIIRTNLPVDIQRKCAELRTRFPEVAIHVEGIESWTSLYHFFDAVDLWSEGPDFCYFVIHRLGGKSHLYNCRHVCPS